MSWLQRYRWLAIPAVVMVTVPVVLWIVLEWWYASEWADTTPISEVETNTTVNPLEEQVVTLPVEQATAMPTVTVVLPSLVAEPTPTPMKVSVTGNVVNLRAGPGTEFEVSGKGKAGDVFQVAGATDDGTWLLVEGTNTHEGWAWISASMTNMDSDNSQDTETPMGVGTYDSRTSIQEARADGFYFRSVDQATRWDWHWDIQATARVLAELLVPEQVNAAYFVLVDREQPWPVPPGTPPANFLSETVQSHFFTERWPTSHDPQRKRDWQTLEALSPNREAVQALASHLPEGFGRARVLCYPPTADHSVHCAVSPMYAQSNKPDPLAGAVVVEVLYLSWKVAHTGNDPDRHIAQTDSWAARGVAYAQAQWDKAHWEAHWEDGHSSTPNYSMTHLLTLTQAENPS